MGSQQSQVPKLFQTPEGVRTILIQQLRYSPEEVESVLKNKKKLTNIEAIVHEIEDARMRKEEEARRHFAGESASNHRLFEVPAKPNNESERPKIEVGRQERPILPELLEPTPESSFEREFPDPRQLGLLSSIGAEKAARGDFGSDDDNANPASLAPFVRDLFSSDTSNPF